MKKINLNNFQKKILSQHGQDGILEKIYELIGVTNKYFVEFGSSGTDDGMGNTAYLRSFGFNGLLMDGSENPYNQTVFNKKYPVNIEFITAANINKLFEKYNVPEIFDLLSIDIDGQDFYVWKELNSFYKPRIVTIECNYYIQSNIDCIMPYNENHNTNTHLAGASILALKNLGNYKNYSLVAATGADLIFIRDDIINDCNIKFEYLNDVYNLQKLNCCSPHEELNQDCFKTSWWNKSTDILNIK
jgi:hypothetical protein